MSEPVRQTSTPRARVLAALTAHAEGQDVGLHRFADAARFPRALEAIHVAFENQLARVREFPCERHQLLVHIQPHDAVRVTVRGADASHVNENGQTRNDGVNLRVRPRAELHERVLRLVEGDGNLNGQHTTVEGHTGADASGQPDERRLHPSDAIGPVPNGDGDDETREDERDGKNNGAGVARARAKALVEFNERARTLLVSSITRTPLPGHQESPCN